ncbi:unnamed protein product [Alopecurus aequalis]
MMTSAPKPADREETTGVVVFFPPLPSLPPLPALPSLPPFPALPGFTPTTPSPPQRANCLEHLMTVLSCVPYLTGASSAPPERCCTSFRALVDGSSSMCLCHVITANPALNRYINGTIEQVRMFGLPFTCSSRIPLQLIYCFVEPLPPFP